ncbi:MAG: class I SAM-dependent methyltransferase [Candidatus Hydrogenedentes bacterium]|nr:class I SAM-dependent methyltransferase [Candidatus Hydrogenedentota bacterium]
MGAFSHWNFRYAHDKLRVVLYGLLNPRAPWFTPDAARFLEGRLEPGWAGLEWGAGRSTLWLAERVGSLISVEHDPAWFARVEGRLRAKGLDNVTLVLKAEGGPAYAGVADTVDDGSLDFVLVDGVARLRDVCALAAIAKIRPGGLLIIDDVHRYLPSASRSPLALPPDAEPLTPGWAEFAEATQDWACEWTSSGVQDTAIWQRPGAA